MYYEKLGFMLTFWNLAGVPFTYCHCALYFANHHPDEYHWNTLPLLLLVVVYLFFYWMWDTANSQKNGFRQMEKNQLISRNTFPQLPWQVIKNPKVIETKAGDRIMVDGWFGIIRKPNYVPDIFFSFSWGLITGFKYVPHLPPWIAAAAYARISTDVVVVFLGAPSRGFTPSSSWA